jgi:methanogenic corrinoid protein MtbC1/DNA-binding XRE family transcriptional regulator
MSDFATRLRELRKRRGLRQVDLANAFGIAQTTIANYEKKLRFPDELMLVRFADFFSVSLDFLMGRSTLEREPQPASASARELSPGLSGKAIQYLELLRGNRAEAASELVEASVREGHPLGQIYLEILEPALKETGRLWERGELRVGEEHVISMATQRIMARIFQPPAAPKAGTMPAVPPVCLIMAASGEYHVIGPAMVSDLLRMDGWEVLFPVGNMSIRHVLEMTTEVTPQLIALSVTIPEHVSGAADLIAAVRETDHLRGVRIMVGGQAFQSRAGLWQQIGAEATATDAAAAVLIANRLVSRQAGLPALGG